MTPYLLSGPAVEPLTLSEAKAWLRLDTSDEDDLVTALIVSARLMVEAATRRALITQSWRLVYDGWPPLPLRLRPAPVQSVSAVRVYDVNNVSAPVAPSTYWTDASPDAARLVFNTPPPAPGRAAAGIEIDVTAGYGAASSAVPEPLRQAARMLVAHWFEARGDTGAAALGGHLPAPVAALVAPFRVGRLV